MLLAWAAVGCLLLSGGARAASEFISSRAYFHHLAAAYWGEEGLDRRRRDLQLALVYDATSPTLRRQAAQDHLERDRTDRALEAAQDLSDPLVAARIALARGELEAAERQLRRALRAGSEGQALGRTLGQLHAARPQPAVRLAERALGARSPDPGLAASVYDWATEADAWELAAMAARARMEPPRAWLAVGTLPSGPNWPLRWAEALHRLGQVAEAHPTLEGMAAQGPGRRELTWARLSVAAWVGNVDQVRRLARREYRLRTDAADRRALSLRLLELGHPELALEFGRPDGELEARLAFAAGEPGRALSRLKSRPAGSPDLERQAVEALLAAGRPAQALDWLNRRLPRPAPGEMPGGEEGADVEEAELRVRAWVRAQRPAQARRWLEAVPTTGGRREALRAWVDGTDPVDPAPATRLALARARDQVTLEILDAVPRLDFRGQVERAVLGLQSRDRPADAALRALQRQRPDHPDLWWGWGLHHAFRQDWEPARRALERAVRLDPTSGRSWEALGDAWCDADPERARRAYRRAVQAFEAAWRSGRSWTRAPAQRAEGKVQAC